MIMNRLTILFLALLLALPTAMKADSAQAKKDDGKYLAGAVPEADGKVVFSKEFRIPGTSQAEIYGFAAEWIDERLKENKNADSRIVFSDEAKGTIAGMGEEWLVFKSSALSLDRTLINYQITVTCKPGSLLVELEKIRFTYRDTEKYKAEEWITDEYALNKAKTKLVRGLAKWRRKTVDFADALFADASAGLLLFRPAAAAAADTRYTEIDLAQIPDDVYALMRSGKTVISIGKDEFNMTSMTANGGGTLGYQSGTPVAYCTLAPDQPCDAVEKADSYTLKVYAPGQTTPSAIVECKKLPSQATPQAGQPRTYAGEIVKLLLMK